MNFFMQEYPKNKLSSYGLLHAESFVCKPANEEEILGCIDFAKSRGLKINPTGSRLSFSNVCLLNENISLDLNGLDKIISFDHEKGEITVQAGAKIPTILSLIMPQGYTLIGLTGSLGNTVGGNIGNDVNGKDSWKNGHFGENVISFKMITADGKINQYTREASPEIFNAVIGGMGLIGILTEVTLKLLPISSVMIRTETKKVSGIRELVDTMSSLDPNHCDFAYCWTDPNAPFKKSGRGICETASFSKQKKSISTEDYSKQFIEKKRIGPLNPETFWSLFRKIDFPFFYKYSGYLKYHLPKKDNNKHVFFTEYQYPMLKYFPKWNLKYYPLGFREIQLLFPSDIFSECYGEILSYSRSMNFIPYVCAVRKHKKQSPYLSFSADGFSMTLNYGLSDHPENKRREFERELIRKTVNLGGKIYLGKFPFIPKEELLRMYTEINKFKSVKKSLDPTDMFWSDAAEHICA